MFRISLILALTLSIVTLVVAMVVPDLQDRKDAIGSLEGLSPDLQRTFTPGDDFAPLPEPGGSD